MVKHFGLKGEYIEHIIYRNVTHFGNIWKTTNERTNGKKKKERKHQYFNFYLKLIFV